MLIAPPTNPHSFSTTLSMSPLNPIIYIPPTVLVLAIGGIVVYNYHDRLLDVRDSTLRRLGRLWTTRGRNSGRYDRIQDQDVIEAVQEWAPGQNPGLGQLEDEDFEFDEDEEEEILDDEEGNINGADARREPRAEGEEEGELMPDTPATTTTSARLRMHHEMVQQMRARAGFAPEPFPGDEPAGGEGNDDEDEDDEEGGGAGSSQAHAATANHIRRIGKKKAEKLQRKEQMRAYREFMDAQREERRQQEEMYKAHEAALQEERQRKRTAQIEKDRQRKEFLKKKELKDQESKLKQSQIESLKDESVRKELLAYIQRIKSFRLPELAKRMDRTEAQVLKDLAALAQETSQDQPSSTAISSPPPRIILASNLLSPLNSPVLMRSKSGAITSTASPTSHQILVLHDSSSDQYVVLNDTQLRAFAEKVQAQGRVHTKELSKASQDVFTTQK